MSAGDDSARAALREIVSRYGPGVADDPRRLAGLMRDFAPGLTLAASLIQAAAEEGVPREIAAEVDESRLRVMARRLEKNRGLTEENALWAVRAWLDALRGDAETDETDAPRPPDVKRERAGFVELMRAHRRTFAAALAILVVVVAGIVVVIGNGSGPAPQTDFQRLHAHISARAFPAARWNCQRVAAPVVRDAGAAAAVQCTSPRATSAFHATYFLFDSRSAMNAWFGPYVPASTHGSLAESCDAAYPRWFSYSIYGSTLPTAVGKIDCFENEVKLTDERYDIGLRLYATDAAPLHRALCCAAAVASPSKKAPTLVPQLPGA